MSCGNRLVSLKCLSVHSWYMRCRARQCSCVCVKDAGDPVTCEFLFQVHTSCKESLLTKCPLGLCKVSVIPPTALNSIDSDGGCPCVILTCWHVPFLHAHQDEHDGNCDVVSSRKDTAPGLGAGVWSWQMASWLLLLRLTKDLLPALP